MLTMDQIYRIKILRNYEGKSLRQISKEAGHHFETVKKYADKDDFNLSPKPTQVRRGKLDPFKPLIDEWLEADRLAKPKQRHTAQRVYNRLKEMYGDEFDVSDRSVRKYVAKRKKDLNGDSEGYLPLEHPVGEAQVDFGEAQFTERGLKYDGYYLNVSFPHSNGGYMQLFKAQNQECLLEGLKSIFEYAGACPTAIWFDNMSTAVKEIKKNRERDLTRGFERFMLHYGFQSNFCNPNSGHEKGNVENKVGYHRRNLLVPIPEFDDIRVYNQELLERCDADMQRPHYKKSGTIAQLFEQDRLAMNALPRIPFEVGRLEVAKADKYGKVKFDTRLYSSSPAVSSQQVWIRATAHDVVIMDEQYREIISHPRLYGDQKESMNWIPYLDLMSKRPTALKYTGIFSELPTTLQDYLDKCEYEEKKAALKALAKMVQQTNLETAACAFEETLNCGIYDVDSVWATYRRLTSGHVEPKDILVPELVPELNDYSTDTTIYDALLVGRRA